METTDAVWLRTHLGEILFFFFNLAVHVLTSAYFGCVSKLFFFSLPLLFGIRNKMDKVAADQRKNNFKNKDAFGVDSVRNRRQQHSVEIRKQKREENLTKRRNMNIPTASMSDSEEEVEVEDDTNVSMSFFCLLLICY